MDLLSFFKRTAAAPAAKPVSDSLDAVQELRLRARRRLIGAAVLVGIGVIGFPLVFETQPRPIPVDLPIEIPRKDALPPLAIPAPAPAPLPAPAASQETPVQSAELGKGIITEAREPEPKPAAAIAPVAKPAEKPAEKLVEKAKPEPKPEAKVEAKPEKKAAEPPKVDVKADTKAEAARVQALLEGKPAADKKASDATGARFIVQVGAYAEAKAVQEARSRVEKLGLKTYTQAVETADGKRIRVRLGPFASREEADKAAAKVRGAGLSTAVLTL
ncbi:SPOR domain-containing protein [Paucibacter sediminis]|uniref:SPOR domain-containing protein n=1 Tax=Paucibacter sediminis TaxID=3019553 RepID=A0AA95SKD1_9BURK|nr:SPOR domain-containing protein [Paucibacter sp. S2-9]WIT10943.1 SPOR domain-containing protein [Paucibacter sp. S2-9]